jgi:hypothetical protein
MISSNISKLMKTDNGGEKFKNTQSKWNVYILHIKVASNSNSPFDFYKSSEKNS